MKTADPQIVRRQTLSKGLVTNTTPGDSVIGVDYTGFLKIV